MHEVAQEMLDVLADGAKLAGLHVNIKKTEYMVRGDLAATEGELRLEGAVLKRMDEFKYLGTYVGSVDTDIDARLRAADQMIGRLTPIWKLPLNKVSTRSRLKLFTTIVEPILFYGCETWPLTAGRLQKLTAWWFKRVRGILKIRWDQKKSNAEIIAENDLLKDPKQTLRERFMGLYGHALRTYSREVSAGGALSPLSQVIAWAGQGGTEYTRARGAVTLQHRQRVGKGQSLTVYQYCLSLVDKHLSSPEDLVAFAGCKASWQALTKD